VQEAYNGFPELKFGNGVVGKALDSGNIIIADYFVSKGEDGNNIRGPFDIPTPTSAASRAASRPPTPTRPSSGGSDQESLDSARFVAPLGLSGTEPLRDRRGLQDHHPRAVRREHRGDQRLRRRAGRPERPARTSAFGRVFIALKPKIGLRFTDVVRQFITRTSSSRARLSASSRKSSTRTTRS
jgi:hypothetical protein